MNIRFLLLAGAWILFAFAGGVSVQAVTRLDTAFGLGGRIAVELGVKNSAHAVVVQPDGKIVVAGSSSKGTSLNFSLLRLNKDGSLDPTFNGDGSVITTVAVADSEALALGLLSDGRIVAAGYSHNGKDRDFALVCYLPDGSRDRAFGGNGVVVTSIGNGNEEIAAITVNSEDMITVAGVTEGTVGRVLVTARYFADGVLDNSFGEQGMNLIGIGKDVTVEGILERKDGSLVISGSYKEKEGTTLVLVGLSAEGRIDKRFGVNGIGVPSGSFVASEGYGLVEDSDGHLYVAGSVGGAGKRDTALFRFTKAGKVDPSFGDKGVVITRVSEQDDVLYAVTVGKSGVIASGYTTDAGTRQFLLVTFSSDGTSAATSEAQTTGTGTVTNGAAKALPIQEVRVNGATRVQIRRLQVSPSFAGYTTVQYLPALPSSILKPPLVLGQAKIMALQADDHFFWARWIPALITRFENFLLPSAVAADTGTSIIKGGAVATHVVTTTFSEGESVSYAATFDSAGNVIVVGTVDGTEASSIVVAQYVTESMTDRITDQPGYRSSHITTAPTTAVTKSAMVTGGEITPSFGNTVIKRGVVFSMSKDPTYSGNSDIQKDSQSITIGTLQEGEALDKTTATFSVAPDIAATNTTLLAAGNLMNGETANGSGYGAFSARLEKLKPGTTYYVRAYALTAEDRVYYGNQLSFRSADACFIATASFGTLLHPSVRILRDFRDTFLVNTTGGQRLVDLYYAISPPLADCIARHEGFRVAVRLILLPLIGFSWLALQIGMVLALLIVAGSATMLVWLSSLFCLRR